MKPLFAAAVCSVLALAACDSSNPFMENDTGTGGGTDGGTDTGGGTDAGGEFGVGGVPPGVSGPNGESDDSIVRFEERNAEGGGYAEDFQYDAATDTFTVDNLAFDGEGPYSRGTTVASLGPNDAYAVYDAEVIVDDFATGSPVRQIVPYRAIVGVSPNTENGVPRTSFAIVRTGGYRDFGFGGFVYQREGGVVLPTTGQATYSGDYAGMRIFSGPDGTLGGLEFTEADMRINIDFDDPTNAAGGVSGLIFNRVAYDINGNPVSLGNDTDGGELPLPVINFVLDGDNGNLNADGELTGGLISSYVDTDGVAQAYEEGTYYGILAGDTTTSSDGGELVGVLVLTSQDPRFEGVTAQETGGFILLR